MYLEILRLVITVIFSMVGAGFAIYKLLDRRLSKQDNMLLQISNDIAALKAGSVAYITVNRCNILNKEAEAKTSEAIKTVKEEIFDEVEAVEERISKRLDKLETKIDTKQDK